MLSYENEPDNKYNSYLENAFNRNYVVNLFFNENDTNNSKGIYPGKVNNYPIMKFKDSWIDADPNEFYTNIYLKKGIMENVDFMYVGEEQWSLLEEFFGYNLIVDRRVANIGGNMLIEVNLRSVSNSNMLLYLLYI